MTCEPKPEELLSQPWNEGACRGYLISAMERCGFKPTEIERAMWELHESFDLLSLEEAQALYERSPY